MNQYQTSTITSQSTPSVRYGLFHEIAMSYQSLQHSVKDFARQCFTLQVSVGNSQLDLRNVQHATYQ